MLHENVLAAQKYRIGSFSPAQVRAPAFQVLTRIQGLDPGIQLLAVAVALCAMSQACELDMREVIYTAENLLRDCEGPYTEHIQAIRDYARGELVRRGQ